MRRTRPGSIQSALQQAVRAAGGVECAADDLGVNISTVSRATDYDEARPGGLGINHLDRLGRIVPGAAVPLARHFAQLAGGFFQPLPGGGESAADVARLTAEFSGVLSTHAEAMSERSARPGGYTMPEARAQIVELDRLIAGAAAFRAGLMGIGE